MKRIATLLAVGAILTMPFASFATESEAGAWFDLKNCDMCKSMSSIEGLMENMQWDNHLIATGAVSVTSVNAGWEDKFEKAHMGMEAVGKKMAEGAAVNMCNFCKSYGACVMAGAKCENFKSPAGWVGTMTSTDPAVIAQIQKHWQTTIDEYNKMMEAEKAKATAAAAASATKK